MGAPSKTRSRNLRGNINAAKPAGTQRVMLGAYVAPETAAKIKDFAKANGISVGKAIDALVMGDCSIDGISIFNDRTFEVEDWCTEDHSTTKIPGRVFQNMAHCTVRENGQLRNVYEHE